MIKFLNNVSVILEDWKKLEEALETIESLSFLTLDLIPSNLGPFASSFRAYSFWF